MTPAARDAAAIAILDRWTSGVRAERAFREWAQSARYAGSADRAAVRDRVFDAIRCARSAAALGGGAGGRAMLLGLARLSRRPPEGWTGVHHSPAPLTEAERALFQQPIPPLPRGVVLDCPDWLLPYFDAALGPEADAVLAALRMRAPVILRVNVQRIARDRAIALLAAEGIDAVPHPLSPWALEVSGRIRALRQTRAFREGFVELQDAASQAAVAAFARYVSAGAEVLDFCAGGGGKALALAQLGFQVAAYDAEPRRMRDLPLRAARARVSIPTLRTMTGLWPAVLVDAPCSGSGSWRRDPEGKWSLTPARLARLLEEQAAILDQAAALTVPGGVLGYCTCSLFSVENEDQVARFLVRHPGWKVIESRRWTPLQQGDGFGLAVLRAPGSARKG